MSDEEKEPTPEAWARTLIGGIGVYEEFPNDHAEMWPTIIELVRQEGYKIVRREDAFYAEKVRD